MEDLDKRVAEVLAGVAPYIILAKFAHWSIILTAILALLTVTVGLPFHYLWGFALVPIGGLFAIYVSGRIKVIAKPK